MCDRTLVLDASATGMDDLAYKMVRLCSILGYEPEDAESRSDFEKILSGDIDSVLGDRNVVTDEALDLLNAHVKEGQGYEFSNNSVFLYNYCANPFDNDECME